MAKSNHSRRAVMTLAMALLTVLPAACTTSAPNQPRAAPSLALVADSQWPRLQQGRSIGQAVGVAVDAAKRVYLFHRADRKWIEPFPKHPIAGDTIALIDPTSGLVHASWGAGLFIMPHGLSVDATGNVWVTDVGAHQVRKFSADGKLLLTLGEYGVSGNDSSHFARPTDVAFGPDGTVYISDGYINTRIARFTPDGRFLGEWGQPGTGPGQFNTPHGIAVDQQGRVYVADRENSRLQIFDAAGRYIDQWRADRVGKPYGVTVAQDGSIYVVDGGVEPATRARIVRLSRGGRVLGVFTAAVAQDGDVLGHDIALTPDGTIYVADVWANRLRRLVPERLER